MIGKENNVRTISKLLVVLPLALTARSGLTQPADAGAGSAATGTEPAAGSAATGTSAGSATTSAASPPPIGPREPERAAEMIEAKPPEPTAGPTLSGFVDTTYNYNANRPTSGKNTYFPYSSQHNSFALNTADLAISGSVHSLSYYIQVDLGSDAAANAYAYGFPTIFDVQEAYAQYTSKDKWGIKVGKFVTYSGIEVIESGANPTISRGYLFSLAEPFSHIGAVATYQATDQLDFALGAINGWDLLADNNRFKMIVAKLGINLGDPLGLTISSYVGPDQANNSDHWRATIDVTGVTKHGNTSIGFQGNFGFEQKVTMAGEDDHWFGFGIQPVVRLADQLSIGMRAEMFRDDKGSRGVLAPRALLFNVTVAPAYTVTPGLMLRVEARLDVSNKDAFEGRNGAKRNQVVGMAEAIASF